jgi:hypothetical protein
VTIAWDSYANGVALELLDTHPWSFSPTIEPLQVCY